MITSAVVGSRASSFTGAPIIASVIRRQILGTMLSSFPFLRSRHVSPGSSVGPIVRLLLLGSLIVVRERDHRQLPQRTTVRLSSGWDRIAAMRRSMGC